MIKRILLGALLVHLVLALVGVGAGYMFLRGSLPQLDGERPIAGLRAPVSVERDEFGATTIRGDSRLDVARATGFVHAQDRFFQMDLLRRSAAGELAALVGAQAVNIDRDMRLHGLRQVANVIVSRLPTARRRILEAYSSGVNDGLAALSVRPFEYALLKAEPQQWTPADSILVVLAMYVDLQDPNAQREAHLAAMRQALPKGLFEFLTAHDPAWDAPLDDSKVAVAALPNKDEIDLRERAPQAIAWGETEPRGDDLMVGSNNWAIGPTVSADGRAWLADDMHLGLRMPNIWYRLRLEWREVGRQRAVTGVSLPGTPAIVVGSNGQIAWGFTNTYGDWSDLVRLELDPENPNRYRTPDGYRPFAVRKEWIDVKGGRSIRVTIRETIWGPVKEPVTDDGEPTAVRWTAHDPSATDLDLLALETAGDLNSAMAIANGMGVPAQNMVAVDQAGNIGWTVAGRIPRRVGYDPRLPASGADGAGWQGWVSPRDYPRVVNPSDGRLWTANNRVIGGNGLAAIGDGGYALGARAKQIRDDLRALSDAKPTDLLAIQLDDRALFLQRWRDLMLELLTEESVKADPRRAALKAELEKWRGRAVPESVAYRLVRSFRLFLHEAVFESLTADVRKADPDFRFDLPQAEQALWRLATERPPHLLDSAYASWDEQLQAVVDRVIVYFWNDKAGFANATWGRYNRLDMRHPLTMALPWLGPWLNVPNEPMPGDANMPRVQAPSHGASQRMVVSPGQEAKSILHMPGGQSGHPLSPFYQHGHDDWVEGRPTPFLPGATAHRLVLQPAASAGGRL